MRLTPSQQAASAALVCIMLALLACTANDTLFIRLTATPVPSLTPTPLSIQTKFSKGDKVIIVGFSEFTAISLPSLAGPFRPGVPNATTCFPNTRVDVLDVSRNTVDASDPFLYYQVRCAGKDGWLPEYSLTLFNKNDKAKIIAAEGAPMYPQAELAGQPVHTCPLDAEVTVQSMTNNPFDITDTKLFIEITCEKKRGYVLEETLGKG
jgi:hypothetical protein